MNVQPINNSRNDSRYKNLNSKVQLPNDNGAKEEGKTLAFISDFTSPDETIKKVFPSKTDAQKSNARARLSSTSENWIG
ncbi:MAG: hypothetical protein AB1521_02585 [Bacteroidota bacterium]